MNARRIPSTPLSTSMLVAAAELVSTRRDGLRARFARACLEACGNRGRQLLRCVDSPSGRLLLRMAESAALPGITAHYAWRKRRIRHWLHAEVAAGTRQLLVTGAGFDALGPEMLAAAQSLRVFELDRPATIAIRRHALEVTGSIDARLALRGADLGQASAAELVAAFEADGFDRHAPVAVVAEGLLMYLQPAAITALCRGLRSACRSRIALLATVMEADTEGRPRFRRQRPWLRPWLAARGEPFLWGTPRTGLAETMAAAGVHVERVADADDPCDPDPCPGELLFSGCMPAA